MTRVRLTARSARARRGVTLVEMLVATAMCILGMWMLTWMFQQATASFIQANQQSTLTGQERMVTTIMTRDLDTDRFPEDERFLTAVPPRGSKRMSDYPSFGKPPSGGYFLASAGVPDNTMFGFFEAYDTNNFGSSRSGSHALQFTVIRPDTPGNRVSVAYAGPNPLPTGVSTSTAGTAIEVSYFLVQTGTSPGNPSVKLYDLMRVTRLVAHSKYDAEDLRREVVDPWYAAGDAVEEVIAAARANALITPPLPTKVYTLADLVSPQQPAPPFPAPPQTPARFAGAGGTRAARTTTSRRYGEDRLLSNVLSFEVKFTGPVVEWPAPTDPRAWPSDANSPNEWPRRMDRQLNPGPFTLGYSGPTPAGYLGNSDYPYDFLPFDGQFDTGDPDGSKASKSNPQAPTRMPIRVTSVQIRVRALSGTTARQTTFVVAL